MLGIYEAFRALFVLPHACRAGGRKKGRDVSNGENEVRLSHPGETEPLPCVPVASVAPGCKGTKSRSQPRQVLGVGIRTRNSRTLSNCRYVEHLSGRSSIFYDETSTPIVLPSTAYTRHVPDVHLLTAAH